MPGNTADDTTLAAFLEKIERQYGRSDRIWIMDRGIPTETWPRLRDGMRGALVGTPKGRLTRLEKAFLDLPWQEVRVREQAAGRRRRSWCTARGGNTRPPTSAEEVCGAGWPSSRAVAGIS